jgi:hypothetical protein
VTEEVVTQRSSIKHRISDKSKTKYMKINRNITNLEHYLIIDGQVCGGVQNFRYLGTLINFKNVK